MSIETSQRVWTESSHSGSALLALLALADRADDDGYCWPAIAEIARRARVSERQVKRILEQLEASGELYIVRSAGRGRKSEYLVLTGQSADKIARSLVLRLGAEVEDAQRLAGEICARQKGDTQGEKVTPVSPLDAEKGDTQGQNVTPTTPFAGEKGDIQGQEKVTSSAEKGDTQRVKVTPSALKGDMGPEKSVDERKGTSVGTPLEPPGGTGSGLENLFDFAEEPPPPPPSKPALNKAKLVAGKIPPGMGETPAEVFFEIHAYSRSLLDILSEPAVAETVTDLATWRDAVRAWKLEGNKVANVNGQLEWYETGKRSNRERYQNGLNPNGNHRRNTGTDAAPSQSPNPDPGWALTVQLVNGQITEDEYAKGLVALGLDPALYGVGDTAV